MKKPQKINDSLNIAFIGRMDEAHGCRRGNHGLH